MHARCDRICHLPSSVRRGFRSTRQNQGLCAVADVERVVVTRHPSSPCRTTSSMTSHRPPRCFRWRFRRERGPKDPFERKRRKGCSTPRRLLILRPRFRTFLSVLMRCVSSMPLHVCWGWEVEWKCRTRPRAQHGRCYVSDGRRGSSMEGRQRKPWETNSIGSNGNDTNAMEPNETKRRRA